MHLSELTLRNIRSFHELHLSFPAVRPNGNWCVILGDNGVGKSTILRAIALALVSDRVAARLLSNPASWPAQGVQEGECTATFAGERYLHEPYMIKYVVTGLDPARHKSEAALEHTAAFTPEFEAERDLSIVAGYGPFRRPEEGTSKSSIPFLDQAFRSLFDDSTGIRDLEDWLLRLALSAKDEENQAEPKRRRTVNLLKIVQEIIDGLWPDEGKVHLQIGANGIYFVGMKGEQVWLADMSDGYRAIFVLACDLLRHAVRAVESDLSSPLTKAAMLSVSGIVLIDEIDVHLHPKWQREIGFYLQRTFPKIQFIVATHSPFVAQAAMQDGVIILERDPETGEVTPDTSVPSLRGVPAEDILQSRVFDLEVTLDPITESELERRATLVAKRQGGRLTADETQELSRLEADGKPIRRKDTTEELRLELKQLLQEAQRKND